MVTPQSEYRRVRLIIALLTVVTIGSVPARAQLSDIWTEVNGPAEVTAGGVAQFQVTYGNSGPDSAAAYVNLYIPSGYPAHVDVLTQDQYDALFGSAVGTDVPLGNAPLLFFDDSTCQGLMFQVQRDDGDPNADPVEGLHAGVSSTWTFDLEIPMDPVGAAMFRITDPPGLANQWIPATTTYNTLIDATATNRIGLGASCDGPDADGDGQPDYPNCVDMAYCLGDALWTVAAFAGELEVVDDGVAEPTDLCEPIDATFTPGRIAVGRRGGCYFSDKVLNAQLAGATGLLLVNDGRCSSLPGNDLCVINMSDGTGVSPLVSIPFFMVSIAHGEPIISHLDGGGTVTATVGGHPAESFELDSMIFHSDATVDPDRTNDDDYFEVWVTIFADGFESGDATAWSFSVP